MSGYTIDASVFGNATVGSEPGHEASAKLLALAERRREHLVLPSLLLAELAGLLARRFDDELVARRVITRLLELDHCRFVGGTIERARAAAELAAGARLRGADAFYVEVARRHRTVLVTRDREQALRAAGVVQVTRPEEILERWQSPGTR